MKKTINYENMSCDYSVLNKVKPYFNLPGYEGPCLSMVATWFETSEVKITHMLRRYWDDFQSDGVYYVETSDMLKTLVKCDALISRMHGKSVVKIGDTTVQISAGIQYIFTPKSLLRMCYVIQNSYIAEKVKKLILNDGDDERIAELSNYNAELYNGIENDILTSVKSYNEIPFQNAVTLGMAAEYFCVDEETMQRIVSGMSDELKRLGMFFTTVDEIENNLKLHSNIQITRLQENLLIVFDGKVINLTFHYPTERICMLPVKAVLKLATLLVGNPIAEKVRKAMLSTAKTDTSISGDTAVSDGDAASAHDNANDLSDMSEDELCKEVGKAYLSGDVTALKAACEKIYAMKKQIINELEQKNSELRNLAANAENVQQKAQAVSKAIEVA